MKTLTIPYAEYQSDLLDMRRQGFDQAIRLISNMLKLPANERMAYLEDNLDADAHSVAEKLKQVVPT